jgi:hypothetical protein
MTYVPKDHAELAIIYLTRISSFRAPKSASDHMYIPLAAKYHTPEKFGQYVARHNEFLNDHRNVSIVGIVPDAMAACTVTGANLWTSIRSLTGIFRCNPCWRTPDPDKRHISHARVPAIKKYAAGLTPIW